MRPLRAGFAQAAITPRSGTRKIGWLKEIIPTRALDPLFAKAAVIDSPRGGRIAIVALDTLFVREDTVARVRSRAARLQPQATHDAGRRHGAETVSSETR